MTLEILSPQLFAAAVIHTFSTRYFEHRAHQSAHHAGFWHLLGEVEVVFGFWAILLFVVHALIEGHNAAVHYVETRNYTEPLFVFAIMVVAASRPVLYCANAVIGRLTRSLPLPGSLGFFFVVLSVVPLLGSFITEPAAMTLAALMLSKQLFARPISEKLKYATLGVLFVNISIGGTLTPFAAPPVLMVASTWGWDFAFMSATFGSKAALAITVNTAGAAFFFRHELMRQPLISEAPAQQDTPVPPWLIVIHLLLLAAIVFFAHYPAMFLGLFLLFLGLAEAYPHHQDRLILKEALLVAFFLAGLVVLGGQQQAWLQPLLMGMSADTVYFGAIALTAFTDNAALTYLGSLVDGLSDDFKYALVSGAVTGGGLTIIANAPNPAGVSILRKHFHEGTVSPLRLLIAALLPTTIALLAFRYF